MTEDLKQVIADASWTQFDAESLFADRKEKTKQGGSQGQSGKGGSGKGNKGSQSQSQQSVSAKQLAKMMQQGQVQAAGRAMGNRQSSSTTDAFDHEHTPPDLEVAFQKGRELIRKMSAEEDFTSRVAGQDRWDGLQLAKSILTYKFDRVLEAKYKRPLHADIVMLLDISGSCAEQARMFMAIAAGAIGKGVRIFVGFNGTASMVPLAVPHKQFSNFAAAASWVEEEIRRPRNLSDLHFSNFVEAVRPKTCVVFGDFDGREEYYSAIKNPKMRGVKFFWFANVPPMDYSGRPNGVPNGWTRKNYCPCVMKPADLVAALRTIR